MAVAEFKLTANSVRALQRLGNAPAEIAAGTKQGLAEHAWQVKKGFRAKRGTGARGLRFEDPQQVGGMWVVVFKLRYIAAWLEEGTKPHLVLPRGRGRARLHRKTGEQMSLPPTKAGRSSGKRALSTPEGPRAAARVSGIRARWYFEQYLAGQRQAGNRRITDGVTKRMSSGGR